MKNQEINKKSIITPDECFNKFEVTQDYVKQLVLNIYYNDRDTFITDNLCEYACSEIEMDICFILNKFPEIKARWKAKLNKEIEDKGFNKLKEKL